MPRSAAVRLFDAAGNAKPGIPQSIVNMRFRDGSIYNSTVTDGEGNYEFAEVFPFFNWLVAETDFTRFKATGATIIADNGGAVVDPPAALAGLWPAGTLTPQLQPENNNRPYRVFGGVDNTGAPVAPSSANLLQAFQGFLGQTNVIHWGKSEYNPADPNDHGGITGVVHYASTRAEFDPKFATPENNEPGIPSVEIRLYKLNNQNKVVTPSGAVIEPSAAKEQDAVQVVVSDNWNKAQPQNCVTRSPTRPRRTEPASTSRPVQARASATTACASGTDFNLVPAEVAVTRRLPWLDDAFASVHYYRMNRGEAVRGCIFSAGYMASYSRGASISSWGAWMAR